MFPSCPAFFPRGKLAQGASVASHRKPSAVIPARLAPILLLLGSNLFMTMAWYGHLKFKDRPLWLVVIASWGLAFFEYWMAVPANRWGSGVYSAAQLKAIQEVITLVVFSGFSV